MTENKNHCFRKINCYLNAPLRSATAKVLLAEWRVRAGRGRRVLSSSISYLFYIYFSN